MPRWRMRSPRCEARTTYDFEIESTSRMNVGAFPAPHNKHSGDVMTITKRMLLGSAAALTAISSTQAADLPVKAKPVQYVRICDLYGSGFYYIPGSEICLKVGGYVQADYGWERPGSGEAP